MLSFPFSSSNKTDPSRKEEAGEQENYDELVHTRNPW